MDLRGDKLNSWRDAIIAPVIAFTLLLLMPVGLLAQDDHFTPSRDEALKLFEDGKYDESLKHYQLLLDSYPADPLYKYYSGVCLLESQKNIEKSLSFLKAAIEESSSLRKVPENAWYYLGKAHQQSENYDEAIICYNTFRDKVRKKDLKGYNLDELIDQCVQGQSIKTDESDPVPSDTIVKPPVSDELAILITPPVKTEDDILSSTLLDDDNSLEETSDDYDVIARQAIEYQFKADSLSRLADRYRSTVRSLTGMDREAISKKIIALEKSTFEFQSLADKKLTEASAYYRDFYGEDISTVDSGENPYPASSETDKTPADTMTLALENDSIVIDTANIATDIPDTLIQSDPILELFDTDCTQPDQIAVNDTLPEGLFYRIQTAAFRNPVKPGYFKTLGPVYGIKAQSSDITFYSIGFFRTKADADKAVLKVRAAGFKDAFVIAQHEGKRISFERSELLEKEWGMVSLFDPQLIKPQAKPSEPVTLVFRVQVIKSEEELPEDEIETLKLVAGNRPFDILRNEEEEYVYLIGKFLTFESALSYSDLLFRNGMKESRVAAYMGQNEIPVEKARELFDVNYKK